jgi:hypothetical protein
LDFLLAAARLSQRANPAKFYIIKISKDNFLVTKLPLGTKVAAKLSLAGQGVRQPGLAARL